jgi:hypothetical protein
MASLLQGRFLLLTIGASGAQLYCEEINFEVGSQPFTRPEWDKRVLKDAPENTGNLPTFGQTLEGGQVQWIYGSATTARDLTPNNNTNLASMEEKFFYNRYTITGDTSLSSDTGLVYTWSGAHKTLQDRFDAHQKYSGDGYSYQDLVTQQAENFSYLTTTGLSLNGSTLGALSNLLIRSFSVNPVRDIQGLKPLASLS